MISPRGVARPVFDPLQVHQPLPLSARLYPCGFAVDIESNSREILAAADDSWGKWQPAFEAEPVRIRIAVASEGDLAMEPSYRAQEHLLTIVSDRDNFACVDLERLFGWANVSQATAGDHAWLRWYFLEAMAYCALAQRHVAPMHAATVARNGIGVMIHGPSGAGKSTLAYACARAGWTFVSDDGSNLLQDSDDCVVIGNPYRARFRDDSPQLFPELAGYAVRARPHGKLSLEVPMYGSEGIVTAPHCEVGCVILIERGHAPRLESIRPGDVIEELNSGACFYGDAVRLRHEKALRRTLAKPVYRMYYRTLDEAIAMLEEVTR